VLGRPCVPAVDQGVLDDGGATGAVVGWADVGGESVGVVDGGVVAGGVVGAGDVVVVAGGVVCVGAVVGVVVGLRVGSWLASMVSGAAATSLGRDREASVWESRAGGGEGGGVVAGGRVSEGVITVAPPPSSDDAPDCGGMPGPGSCRTPDTAASAEPPISMAAVAPPMIIGGRRNIERAARCLPMYRIASPLVDRVRLVLPCPKPPNPGTLSR
jgi:hypothetical protein